MNIHTYQSASGRDLIRELNILASRNRYSGVVETNIPDTETAYD